MTAVVPPTGHILAPSPSLDLAESQPLTFTLEHVLYILLGAVAAFAHFYLLDGRAFHHDETLHASYAWRIYRGQGYTHDPLLHGPFLYYITALTFLLFGDTDWTARLSAAALGVGLTLLPWLMRREIGRGAALLACGYFLISPVALYVGRFLRHDIYAVAFELLAVIAILRYVTTERPLWHYVLAAALGLMLVTMETFYLFLAIIGSFVAIWVLWQVAQRLLWLALAYGAGAGLVLALGTRLSGPLPLPNEEQALRVRNRPDNDLIAYAADVADAVGPVLRHPVSLLLIIGTSVFAGLMLYLVFLKRDAAGRSAWRRAAGNAPRGSLVGVLDRIPRRQWTIAFGIAFAIYALFFTALPSSPLTPNIAGLVTGVSGSLLYWLGQHQVQRGSQPPHFYLFLLSVYEPLLLIFGPLGLAFVVRRLLQVRRWAAHLTRTYSVADNAMVHTSMSVFAPNLLAWWSLGALFMYSWAGEKMPWLTLHIVVPFTLLSAWAVVQLWNLATRTQVTRLTVVLTCITGVLLLYVLNRLTIAVRTPQLTEMALFWPLLALSLVGLLITTLLFVYRSRRPAAYALLVLTLVFGTAFTIRNNVRLVFFNGDVPVEPLVYVQTSPDVHRLMDRLRHTSLLHTGRLDLPLRYDNETIWTWYLRNYTLTQGSGTSQVGPIGEDVQVVLLLADNVPAHAGELEGFASQRYPLRWWFPECEVYRIPDRDEHCGMRIGTNSLLSRLLRRPWDSQAFAAYWRFWYDRTLPSALGSTDWTLFVRPELADEFGINAAENP